MDKDEFIRRFHQAQQTSKEGRWEEALAQFITLSEQYDPNYAVYFEIGYCRMKLGQHREAINAFRQSLDVYPWHTTYEYLSYTHAELKEWEQAVNYYEKAEELGESTGVLQYYKGAALCELGRHAEALRCFETFSENAPEDDAYYYIGICRWHTGQPRQAIEAFRQSLALNPNNVSTYEWLGSAYSKLKEWKSVVEAYRRALAFNMEAPDIYCSLGYAFTELKEWERALEFYDKFHDAGGASHHSHFLRGEALCELGRHMEAIHALEESLRRNPDYVPAQRRLEEAYRITGYDELADQMTKRTTKTLLKILWNDCIKKRFTRQ